MVNNETHTMNVLQRILNYIEKQEENIQDVQVFNYNKDQQSCRLDELRHITVYVSFLMDKERLSYIIEPEGD